MLTYFHVVLEEPRSPNKQTEAERDAQRERRIEIARVKNHQQARTVCEDDIPEKEKDSLISRAVLHGG